jgi:hypothetical protein
MATPSKGTNPTNGIVNADELLQVAASQNLVSPNVLAKMTNHGRCAAASFLGVDPQMITTEKVTLVTLCLDDSGSMSGYETALLKAANSSILEDLRLADPRNDVLIGIMGLNRGAILPYTRLQDVPEITSAHYYVAGGTPLFKTSYDMLSYVVLKQAELSQAGIPTRTMSLILTDGGDTDGGVSEHEVSVVVKDIESRKRNQVWGIEFGTAARGVLKAMGLDELRIHAANDQMKLGMALKEFSRATSAVATSN